MEVGSLRIELNVFEEWQNNILSFRIKLKCEDVEARIIDYLDNNLTPQEKLDIESHLERCEKCLDEMNESQKMLISII